MESKFYWLKLKRDFFKRHDIRIVEGLPDGSDICLFYLKLMTESVDHEGELRFNKEIPYTPEMLSIITDTKIEIVNKSLDTLTKFGMVEISSDGTIVIDKVRSMIGSAVDNDNANRQRRFREAQKTQALQNVTECVTKNNADVTNNVTKDNESKSKSKSKSIEKELDIDKREIEKRKVFIKPTLDEVHFYCKERNNGIDALKFYDYYESKGWMIGKNPMKDWKAAVRTWERNDADKKKDIPEPISENPFTRLKKEEGLI